MGGQQHNNTTTQQHNRGARYYNYKIHAHMGHTKDQYNTIHSYSALVLFFGAGTGEPATLEHTQSPQTQTPARKAPRVAHEGP